MPKKNRNRHRANKPPQDAAPSAPQPRDQSNQPSSSADPPPQSSSLHRSGSSSGRPSQEQHKSSSSRRDSPQASASGSASAPPRRSSSNQGSASRSVDKLTEKLQMASITATGLSSARLIKPASRPGFGTVGSRITVESNFFRLRIPSNLIVSQYAVVIMQLRHRSEMEKNGKKKKPSSSREQYDAEKEWFDVSGSEPIAINRSIFDVLLSTHAAEIGTLVAYDGRSIAYAPKQTLNQQCLGHVYSLTVGKEGGKPTRQELSEKRTMEVRVRIDHAKDLNFDDVLRSRVGSLASTEFLAALDTVLAHNPRSKYVQVGRSFYSPSQAAPLSRGSHSAVSAWRGFYQSARLSQQGLLLNIDESYTTFWNMGGRPLMDLVREANDGRDPWSDGRAVSFVANKLKALKVRAIHNGITYKVHGFTRDGPDSMTFEDPSGRPITVSEYFANSYGLRLKYGNLPCVKTHPKRNTFLPIEVLVVVENQRMMGLLSPEQTAIMVRHASTRPHEKRQAAMTTMQTVGMNRDRMCRDFGIKADEKLVTVQARVLPSPKMLYTPKGTQSKGMANTSVNNGQWRANEHFFVGSILSDWGLINEGNAVNDGILSHFIRELVKAGGKAGMRIGDPRVYRARQGESPYVMRNVVRDFAPRAKGNATLGVQLIMIIRGNQDAGMYQKIKLTGDTELGVVSQVIFAKNLRNPRGINMYCDNVVLKLNAKLGGQNTVAATFQSSGLRNIPDIPFLHIPHIILGADVTHPMPGGRTPSVAALVGSRDREAFQFAAAIRNQSSRKEVITDLKGMFLEVYRYWLANFGNKFHAQKIIMFRDGVSEGQFQEVMTHEIEALRSACVSLDANFKPKITYIVVTKRHHTKFFPSRNDADRSGNIPAGTVVDRDITSNEFYDFYVCSHSGIQGTNKPSKYTVLVDESNIPQDALQGFIYRLSHGFARCNRSVSMVNSAYYAHLLAFRGRAYIGEEQSDTSSTSSAESIKPVPHILSALAR